jgi:enterochelin esterase-like enzyme
MHVRFAYRDPHGTVVAAELEHDLRERLPRTLRRRPRGRLWELEAIRPDVDRIEYRFALTHRDGRAELVNDPENPIRATAPFGDRSVLELPGYVPPAWLDAKPAENVEAVELPSRTLRASLPALLWTHPEADERSPLLVAHDGPEYAEHSALLTLLPQLRPVRAALIAPIDRNETYSASARYTRALVEDVLPSLGPAPCRIGVGASLGALALLHAHRRHPESFDALLLQSGSFFRRRDVHERGFPRFERISRFVGSVLARRSDRPIPVTIICGTVEENLDCNRALADALRRQGYELRFGEFRDTHNWVGWRDSFQPYLQQLLEHT